MKKLVACGFAALVVVLVLAGNGWTGGPAASQHPPLDPVLMSFKEAGLWYFLCTAPVYHYRIPPHYMTFGPPPPHYCPIPCGPVPAPAKLK